MLRWHLVQLRCTRNCKPHYLTAYRHLCQLTYPKYNPLTSHNHASNKSNNPLQPSSHYLKLQKRSLFTAPSAASVNIMMKGLFVYFLLYISYKFFSKREDRGPRLEIIENHCYSPFHINSILSLIYPKLLGIFQR